MKSRFRASTAGLVAAVLGTLLATALLSACGEMERAANSPGATPQVSSTVDQPSADLSDILLKDMEYVPVYPDAQVQSTDGVPVLESILVYHSTAELSQLIAFYEAELPKLGWSLLYKDRGDLLDGGTWTWSDPARARAWHLFLSVGYGLLTPEEEPARSRVDLHYGRYPDVADSFPLYGDARSIEVETAEEPGEPGWGGFPVRITAKSYLTDATPEEVADYYNSTLEQYGWQFFDFDTQQYIHTQRGNIRSEQGLSFIAHRLGSVRGSYVRIDLTIRADGELDGQTSVRITLKGRERFVAEPNPTPEGHSHFPLGRQE